MTRVKLFCCRTRACALGESAVPSVLLAWDERNAASSACVLDFLALQLRLHHPRGARTAAEGAAWTDLPLWRHQLIRLLQNLVETTIGNRLRQNKARGARSAAAYELAPDLVDLAADIYRQTLAISWEKQQQPGGEGAGGVDQLCDVTQIVPELEATMTSSEPRQKRPRLDAEEEEGGGRRGLDLSWRGLLERTVYGTDTDLGKIPQVGRFN